MQSVHAFVLIIMIFSRSGDLHIETQVFKNEQRCLAAAAEVKAAARESVSGYYGTLFDGPHSEFNYHGGVATRCVKA